jgi:hypothetical protein
MMICDNGIYLSILHYDMDTCIQKFMGISQNIYHITLFNHCPFGRKRLIGMR